MDRIKVGIVGVGGIAHGQHIPGYQRCADVDLTYLCDVNCDALAHCSALCGVEQTTTDYRDLVASPDVDAISVCTSNDMHYPVTMAAIANGKHVFCEKPLGMNHRETVEMYEAAREAGVVAGVGFVHRCTPSSRLAQRIVSSGALGEIYHVIAFYSYGGSSRRTPVLHWRALKERAGAGLIFDLGAHSVDMCRWWLGDEATAVAARTRTFVKRAQIPGSADWGDVTTDDAASFLVDFAGGTIGTFVNSGHFTARGFDQRIEVYGSKGALRYDQSRPYELQACVGDDMVDLYSVRGIDRQEAYPWIPVPADLRDRWTPQLSTRQTLTPDFVAAIRGDASFLPTFEDGMRVQEVLDAGLLSNAEGKWVSLPLT